MSQFLVLTTSAGAGVLGLVAGAVIVWLLMRNLPPALREAQQRAVRAVQDKVAIDLEAGALQRKVTTQEKVSTEKDGQINLLETRLSDTAYALEQLRREVTVVETRDKIQTEAMRRLWDEVSWIRTGQSCYLGGQVVLTNLADESRIVIPSSDLFTSHAYIIGGRYEGDNLDVLQSYLRPDSVFLDIGAHVGVFSIQLAKRIKHGSIYCFEPLAHVFELLTANIVINGIDGFVRAFNHGLSNKNAELKFHHPASHPGRNSLVAPLEGDVVYTTATVKRLDDALPEAFSCDLVKIDVEGHELEVLDGMRRILRRSPEVKILVEKQSDNVGREPELMAFLDEFGLTAYGIGSNATLVELGSLEALKGWWGYILAARKDQVGDLKRSRFTIYPAQLGLPPWATLTPDGAASVVGKRGQGLFSGPYWFLPKGWWRVVFNAEIEGTLNLRITERHGRLVEVLELDNDHKELSFYVERDLVRFECVGVVASDEGQILLREISFVRVE